MNNKTINIVNKVLNVHEMIEKIILYIIIIILVGMLYSRNQDSYVYNYTTNNYTTFCSCGGCTEDTVTEENIQEPDLFDVPVIDTTAASKKFYTLEGKLDISETEEITESNKLTPKKGTFNGPSGKQTYYNLPMEGVVKIMRDKGYSEEEYPYWVREDGCKMLGQYIMVAANLDLRPRGSLVDTSLGTGIVCDTGDFAKTNKTQLDVATQW